MSGLLVFLAIASPLLLAAGFGFQTLRPAVKALIGLAALPALGLSATTPVTLELPWLLLTMQLGVDEITAPLLLVTALIWTAASLYGGGHPASWKNLPVAYPVFYLLTLAGNIGVIIALDAVSFYCFFSLMAFSAYGLIVHDDTPKAYQAGQRYLIMTLFGEAALLAAILLGVAATGTLTLPLTFTAPSFIHLLATALILVSMAIKLAAIPLHFWLPGSYRVAPISASIVLSGSVMNTGILIGLRFLPLGSLELPTFGTAFLLLGGIATFGGVMNGILRRHPKTVAGYSSISQMGLVTVLFGVGLNTPSAWPLVANALLLFCIHHGLAKALLFVGIDLTARGSMIGRVVLIGAALALIGAPFTSGAVTKQLFKEAIYLDPAWKDMLEIMIDASSFATTLLMARLLYLAWPKTVDTSPAPIALGAGGGLFLALVTVPWQWAEFYHPGIAGRTLDQMALIHSLILLGGAALLAVTVWGSWKAERLPFPLLKRSIRRWIQWYVHFPGIPLPLIHSPRVKEPEPPATLRGEFLAERLQTLEEHLRQWPVAGFSWLLLACLLGGLLGWSL